MKKLIRLCTQYDFESCKYVGGIACGYGPQEKMPREEYVKPMKVTFGGRELIAPGCTDYYLTSLYGDYMKLPPEEDRKAHIIKMYQVEE